MTPEQRKAGWRWFFGGDTGVSSIAIWSVMMGADPKIVPQYQTPADSGDFGRCYRLVNVFVPAWRGRIRELATISPLWKALVVSWANLEKLYEAGRNDDVFAEIRGIERSVRASSPQASATVGKKGEGGA